ncbi:hypothetical protein [Candidatus Uabimicrobium sp. HlEnr_7]|uniref:DUF748 domain-containing protein n=1 Tax=Candidatus Uabimicrobium helgolandensis TaxID=3095367 RepID=UPI0035591DCA
MTEEVKIKKNKKKRRLWLKIPLYTLLFIIVVIAFLPLYSSLFISTIVDIVEKNTGRKAQIQSLSVNVFGGSVSVDGVLLKEDNANDDFVKLDKVEIDVSILSLLIGNINIANAEVSGVHVHVTKNKDGNFNFNSILDKLAKQSNPVPEEKEEKKEKEEHPKVTKSTEPMELPSLGAKVTLADINFYYRDLQENSTLEVKKLNFTCNVANLDKIGYQSNWEKAQFEVKNNNEVAAGLVYNLSGNAGIGVKNGKFVLHSKGSLSFLDLYAKGFGNKDVENTNLKITHDLSIDMNEGLCHLNDFQIDSDYINVKGTSFKIDKLDKILAYLSKISQEKNSVDKAMIEDFVSTISFENWTGNFSVTIDLNQFKRDFGTTIIDKINKRLPKAKQDLAENGEYKGDGFEKIEDFGGQITFGLTMNGKEKAVNLTQEFHIKELYVSGKSNKGKNLRIGFDKIAQTFKSNVDLEKQDATANFALGVHPTQKTTLLKITFDSSVSNILDKENLKINKSQEHVFIDFDVLSNMFAAFLPPQTSIRGKFDHKDWISQLSKTKMEVGGNTEVYLQIKSPQVKNLPPFELTGKRSLHVDFDNNQQLQKISIKNLNFQTKGSDIFKLSGKGSLNLAGDNREGLEVLLAVNLGGLDPYLQPFMPELKPRGKIRHNTRVAQKGNKVKIAGSGGIKSLAFALQGTPYSIPKATWRHDVLVTLLENKKPQSVEIRNLNFTHEALQLNVYGAVNNISTTPLAFETGQVKVKSKGKLVTVDGIDVRVDGDLGKVPFFVREMIKDSGVHLQKLEGRFLYSTNLKGNLNKLNITNKIRYRGDIGVRLQQDGQLSSAVISKHGIESNMELALNNVSGFLEQKAPINIVINPKSYFRINNNKNALLYSKFSGGITKSEESLQLDNLSIKILGHGKEIQNSIPVDFLAKNDNSLRKLLSEDLKIDGKFNINTTLNGSPQDLKVDFSKDFTPFVIKFKDAKNVLLDKKADFALAYATEIHLKKQDTNTMISIKNSIPKLGKAKIKMGNMIVKQQADDLHITADDEKSPVTVIAIEDLSFAQLNEMLPIIEVLKLQNAKMQFEVGNLLMHKKAGDISGKLFGRINIPEIDLPHIQKALGSNPKKETKPVSQEKQSTQDAPTKKKEQSDKVITLSQDVRDMLRKFIVDFKIVVDKAQIDEQNTAEEFTVTAALNDKEANNKFMLDVNGKTNDGKLAINAQADLDKEHPQCKFSSDMDNVTYSAALFSPMTKRLNDVVPFPLFKKISFGEGEVIKFSFKGENTWTGLDPRVIKKSLFSNGETSFKISGGKFDLGFDMSNFVDLDSLKQEIEGKIAPLKSQIGQLKTSLSGGKGSVGTLQGTLASIKQKIQPVLDKKRKGESLINSLQEKLKYAPPFLRSGPEKQLKTAKKSLSTYDKEIDEYEQQKSKLEGQIGEWQKKISGFQQQITALEEKIKQQQEGLMSKLKLEDPFSFDFGSLFIAFKVTNDSPYKGESNNWSSHPFSKVNYVEVSFTPKGKPFPALKGWCSLDGTYNFQFKPAEELMKSFKEKTPFLANFIEKEGGVSWGSSGFSPSPVNK